MLLTALPLLAALVFAMVQLHIQHKMFEELEMANTVTITVPASEVHWKDKGREAVIYGKMFDVKKCTVQGENIQLKGLFDEDEDRLFARLNEMQKNNPDKSGSTLLMQWLSCFTGIQNKTYITDNFSFTISQDYAAWHSNMFSHIIAGCDSPPPKI